MNWRTTPSLFAAATCAFADPPEPRFRAVTIDDKVQIGYGVAVADVDGDKLPDILLADKKQFIWYKNPSVEKSGDPAAWRKFVIAENLTKNDNVCLAAEDIDGDGKCELAVGAEWNPGDTENSGAVFYMTPPADRTQRWEAVKLHAEPTTHRMRWIRLADGKWGLVVVPLHGRGNKNGEGAGVRILLYHPPAQLNDPKGEWKTELIDEAMHMTHNFDVVRPHPGSGPWPSLFLAGREGLTTSRGLGDRWKGKLVDLPAVAGPDFKGVGEVRNGFREDRNNFVATVEPMHGNKLVSYAEDESGQPNRVTRQVLTDQLIEGHALGCADLLGIGNDQIVVGWRGRSAERKPGVALWTALDPKGGKWRETLIDDGGMACEDLQLADLNGDGKPDIIASGRATKNLKIYFNEAAP